MGEAKKKSGSKSRGGQVTSSDSGKSASTPSRSSGSPVDLDNLGGLQKLGLGHHFSHRAGTALALHLLGHRHLPPSRRKNFPSRVRGEETIKAEIEVPFETRNWYIPVNRREPNTLLRSDTIAAYLERYRPVLHHRNTQGPPFQSDQFDYATIPLHIELFRT